MTFCKRDDVLEVYLVLYIYMGTSKGIWKTEPTSVAIDGDEL